MVHGNQWLFSSTPTAGGKRLRPVLTLLTARATGATEVRGMGLVGGGHWNEPCVLHDMLANGL